jgi:hypothetical protein
MPDPTEIVYPPLHPKTCEHQVGAQGLRPKKSKEKTP